MTSEEKLSILLLSMYKQLIKDYPSFIYHGYRLSREQPYKVTFSYSIPGLTRFESFFEFPRIADLTPEQFTPFLSSLGLIEALSYWKATCSPVFELPDGMFHEEQLDFWKEIFFQGLSEFRYRNQIESTREQFVSFSGKLTQDLPNILKLESSGNLIPIGGGKDSIVSLEALQSQRELNTPFFMNPRAACMRTTEIAGYQDSDCIRVIRELDPKLIELNKQGYLNGHTPFSALLAFTSLTAAAISKKKYIVLSNEGSASEGNIEGHDVNHQYSKSFHFESLFRDYSKTFLTTDIEYFSFLRPLNEIQIGQKFSQYEKHFGSFRSCNVGCYDDRWCCDCSKCLFTSLLLAPFLNQEQLEQVFPNIPLKDLDLKELIKDLCLTGRVKPFECVGTKDECMAAVKSILQTSASIYPLVTTLEVEPELEALSALLADWNNQHFLPTEFEEILRETH